MKRVSRLSALAAATLVMVLGAASDAGAIDAYGSWWNAKDIDNGYGLGVKHRITIGPLPIVAGELRASWLSFEDSVNLFPLEADARATLGLFYGGGGVGYYVFSGDLSPDNKAGGFLMAGAELALAGLGVFGELKYTWVDTELEGVNVDASGLGINVGVLFGLL